MIYITNTMDKYADGQRDVKPLGLAVESCTKYYLEKSQIYREHFLQYSCIFIVISGKIQITNPETIGDEKSVFYVKKFSQIEFFAETGTDIIKISFITEGNIPFLTGNCRIFMPNSETVTAANEIYRLSLMKDTLPGVLDGIFLNLLNLIHHSLIYPADETRLYQKCIAFIEQNAKHNISAITVADALNYSVAHLTRIVKEHSGKCLSDLVVQRRIFEIKELCREDNISIKVIAEKLQFSNAELLRKFFKYHTGKTLKSYINSLSK